MWRNNKTIYFSIIEKFEKELTVLVQDKYGCLKATQKSYGNTLSLMERLPPLIKALCINDNWLLDTQYSSLGKLLFNNGYFDMREGHFYEKKYFKPEIVFFGKINRDFIEPNEKDLEYIDDLEHRLFFNVLGEEVGTYFLSMLSRGLAGDMMKNIMFCLGDSNCGKSTLTTAIINSCGDYAGSFNAENLAITKSTQDEAQKMRWAMLLRYKRFIFSNEMKSHIEIDGTMIKKISSGGDQITGRTHGQEEKQFLTHYLPICFANDLPNISPYDNAVDNRVRVISYKKIYVDNPENEFELKKDYNIENEMKTENFKNAFVCMLIRRYSIYIQNKSLIEPLEVINGKKEWISKSSSFIEIFLENFEISDNENDFLPNEEIEEFIKNKKLAITITKFSRDMKKHAEINELKNTLSKSKKIDGKTIRGWTGLK